MLELWVLVGLWLPPSDPGVFRPRGMMTELAVAETVFECYALKRYAEISAAIDLTVNPEHYHFFCLPEFIRVNE